MLLTRNLRHLRTKPVLAAGVKVITADEFLCALLADHPQGVVESLTHAADRKKNPPMTPHELAQKMAAAGAPLFAGHVRPHVEEIARQRAAK